MADRKQTDEAMWDALLADLQAARARGAMLLEMEVRRPEIEALSNSASWGSFSPCVSARSPYVQMRVVIYDPKGADLEEDGQ